MLAASAVDLFCGVGGLTHGLIKSGVPVRAGIELDAHCRYAYERNNASKFVHSDVAKISGHDCASFYGPGDLRILAGCAPCQPFSTYTQGRDPKNDEKWGLLYHFLRLIKEVNPEIVTMENVPLILKTSVFGDFVTGLRDRGYFVFAEVVNCQDFGVSQTRRRLVVLASRLAKIKLIRPESGPDFPRTVREAISHLTPLTAGGVCSSDPLHRASRLSPKNLKRIRASVPGGTWRDWHETLKADCHAKPSGKTYPSVYGRMEWDRPAPTMTTQCFGFGNGRFGHPEQDRAISLREAAILQSFPHEYEFVEPGQPYFLKRIGKWIGNAVPVRLGEIIGISILNHLGGIHE